MKKYTSSTIKTVIKNNVRPQISFISGLTFGADRYL